MMKKISFLFLFIVLFVNSQEIEKLNINDYVIKAYFLENKYDEKYILIGDFLPIEEGSKIELAKVFTNTGWGYINKKGKDVIKPVYVEISNFKNGLVVGKKLVEVPGFKGQLEMKLYLINYLGNKLSSTPNYYKDFDNYEYQKGFFITKKESFAGIMNTKGKILVPIKYEYIQYDKDYFFAYLHAKENNYNERIFDVYSKKGKLLKSIKGNSIQKIYDKYFVAEYDKNRFRAGCFSVDSKTFERNKKYEFNIFNPVENSKLFKTTVVYERGSDIYQTFYLDKNFEIVSPDYPNTYIFEDQFLIQPIPIGKDPDKATHFAIIDFENNKIAEYSREDFLLYQYFAYGKLDDPKFLESKKNYWNKLEVNPYHNYLRTEKWDSFINIKRREHFAKFYEVDIAGKKTSSGYVDASTGKIIIKRNLNEVAYIGHITGTDFFQVKYKNTADGNKFDIYDSKGKLITSNFGGYISTDFDVRNKPEPDYYVLDKGKDTVHSQRRNFQQLLNKKDMKPVFKDQLMFFTDPHYVYKDRVMKFTDFITGKSGFIDTDYKIRRMDDYKMIKDDRMVDYNIIYLKKENEIEIVQKKTYETKLNVKFKPGVLKNYGEKDQSGKEVTKDESIIGVYKNGFYLINEEKNIMDRYGNIIEKPLGFDMFQL